MLYNQFLNEFGIRLKFYRLKLGLTQAELGEKINVSEHRISEIECGKCNLTLKTVNKFSNALNISPSKFFDFED